MNPSSTFQIQALPAEIFTNLFERPDAELQAINAVRMIVNQKPGFSCRVSLADAEIDEEVILLAYEHHPTTSPYRASGPIYVRKAAVTASLHQNEIPLMLQHRLLSVRTYEEVGFMRIANVVEGIILQKMIEPLFENVEVIFLLILVILLFTIQNLIASIARVACR